MSPSIFENVVKKDVLINIKGVYDTEDDRDVVEIFTTGTYYKRGGTYFICYDDTEATGFNGSKTTLAVDSRNRVTLERSGQSPTQLIVERGVRHQCHYDMGFGDLMIGVSGSSVKSSLGETGGNLEIKYSLDVNSMLASENEMYINVKESGNPK